MKKYRKKPVVVEAVQWDGKNRKEIRAWAGNVVFVNYADSSDKNLYIETLEGQMVARIGDWIIKGIKGEFYPCKPDIFEATYEEVTQ